MRKKGSKGRKLRLYGVGGVESRLLFFSQPLPVGFPAPDFTLPDQDGNLVTLSALRGRNVVLVFYPADDTSVCTKQLCEFRDRWPLVQQKNTVVLGMNPAKAASHAKFRDRYQFPFPILIDRGQKVGAAYQCARVGGSAPDRVPDRAGWRDSVCAPRENRNRRKSLLPRFYPILDTETAARRGIDVVAAAGQILDAGAQILQLRHKGFFSREVFETLERIAALCKQAGVTFVVNDRADLARLVSAAVHLGQDDLPPSAVRRIVGNETLVGFSTHNEAQLRRRRGGACGLPGSGTHLRHGVEAESRSTSRIGGTAPAPAADRAAVGCDRRNHSRERARGARGRGGFRRGDWRLIPRRRRLAPPRREWLTLVAQL